MTRVLEKLEARGLVARIRGAQIDGRAAMVRITDEGRRTRKLLDELMEQRTRQIVGSIEADRRGEVLNALNVLNNAIEATDCCGLNTPVAKLLKIEGAK